MAKKISNSGESEYHAAAIRLRITGAGSMLMTLEGLNNITSYTVAPLTLAATNRLEPTRLVNFQSQRMRLTLSMPVLNDQFSINRIIIYTRAVATEYPM